MTKKTVAIENALKLDGLYWRYYEGDDGSFIVWTTRQLYKGGDYMAALLDKEYAIIDRRYASRRMDAKRIAMLWYMQRSDYCEYMIREQP